MNNNKKTNIIILILLGVSLAGLLAVYPQLPQIIPTHWNFKGQVDGYGNKNIVFFLWGIAVAVNALFIIVAKIDPRSENYKRFAKVYNLFRLIFTLFMIGMLVIAVILTFDPDAFNINMRLMPMMGLMFVLIGNYLPKCKHNYSFGIKTPWTLASENVWNKTHRMAAPLWVACGVLFMIMGFLPVHLIGEAGMLIITFVLLGPMVVVPMVYSYIEFKKEKQQNEKDN